MPCSQTFASDVSLVLRKILLVAARCSPLLMSSVTAVPSSPQMSVALTGVPRIPGAALGYTVP